MKHNNNKQAKVLCLNDLHIGKDNIKDAVDNWMEALEICRSFGIEVIAFGGDFFLSRSGQGLEVLCAARDCLKQAEQRGITVILANGNHDKVNQSLVVGYCHIFESHRNVKVVDRVYKYQISDGVDLYLTGYFPEENGEYLQVYNEAVETMNKDNYNILYCHQGIVGGLSGIATNDIPAEVFADFDKTIVGHYHNRHKIPNTNIEYIGSSRQHNHGEDIEKGYTIIYSDGSMEFVQNQVNKRYYTIEATSYAESIEKLESIGVDENDKIKIKITCSADEAALIDKQKLLELGASKVEINTEVTAIVNAESNFNVKYDKAGLKSEYVKFCEDRDISEVEMGIDYLNKLN